MEATTTEPTTYSRMTLRFTSPFAKYGESAHIWTVKFALSGAAITVQATAESVAQDLWNGPIHGLVTSETHFVGWLYYPPGSDINSLQAVYGATEYPGSGGAYSGSGDPQQLEVTCLLRCPVGVNSLGRAKYLHKSIHDVLGGSAGNLATLTDPWTGLSTWNDGCGPDLLVPVDPTTGVQGGPWQLKTSLFTRQLRRGKKASS